jgi:KDO2-lipid IV(A) lauroyltransferase
MDFKKIRVSIWRFCAWFGLQACSVIIRFLPLANLYHFAYTLGVLGYYLALKQRRIAMESLKIAFDNHKPRRKLQEIARDCFISVAKSGVELLYLMDKPNLLKSRIEMGGRECLDAALTRRKGVILVSAHFGNFPLLLARLSLEGYQTGGIMRPMRDARTEKIFLAKRQRLKIRTIYSHPRNTCVETTIRVLRNNEIVFLPLDQNFGSGGVFVDFFGKKAATATGPVILAQRTGAAIIPCFIVRQKNDTHRLIFEPAIQIEEGNASEEAIRSNIQKLTSIIEGYIRRYPAEWGWFHRRWKSRPS